MEILKLKQQLNDKLAKLKSEKAHQLELNIVETSSEANKYYLLMSVVFAFQILAHGILMFLYSKIYKEINKEAFENEKQNQFLTEAYNWASTLIFAQFKKVSEKFKIQFDYNSLIKTENSSEQEKKYIAVTGFKNNQDKSAQPSTYVDNSEDSQKKKINYLNKHKEIVKSIKKHFKNEENSLSNEKIRIIEASAYNARYKSYSLIRNVFEVCQAIGLQNIDSNGNIISAKSNNADKLTESV